MVRRRATSAALLVIAVLAGVAGGTATAGSALVTRDTTAHPLGHAAQRESALAGVRVTWSRAAGGLSQPTQVLSAPDGTNRLFVVEKGGKVRVFAGGKLRSKSYLNISRKVLNDGEGGLLSMAFDPRFRTTPKLWVTYTRGNGDLVLARMRASGPGAGHVRSATLRTLLTIEHKQERNHYGGQLVFGPDGYLYMGTGDGGGSGDPFNSAQDLGSLRGKILRIDVRNSCGRKLYCVPGSNPYAGAARGRDEIWLRGLRNPWRFSFDPVSRALWIGDVGEGAYEEVTRVAAQPQRRNLGWSCYEGKSIYNSSRCLKAGGYLGPDIVVPHPRGESVTGGFVYRGDRYASLMTGVYVFGDYVTARVWTYRPGGRKVLQRQSLGGTYAGPTSFGVDDRGEIWAVTYGGGLFRMRAVAR